MRIGSTRKDLRAEIDACGYFPELVEDAVMIALADEELLDFVVHHEPTFNRDEIHRHVTVLALTRTRLVIGHTDDQPAEPPAPGIYAASSTESVALSKINTVALTRVVTQPEAYQAARRMSSRPGCRWAGERYAESISSWRHAVIRSARPIMDTPGHWSGDDLTVRMSAAADGPDRVARLVRFASSLQRAAAV